MYMQQCNVGVCRAVLSASVVQCSVAQCSVAQRSVSSVVQRSGVQCGGVQCVQYNNNVQRNRSSACRICRLERSSAVQYGNCSVSSAVQCSIVWCGVVQCRSVVRSSAVQCSAEKCSVVQCAIVGCAVWRTLTSFADRDQAVYAYGGTLTYWVQTLAGRGVRGRGAGKDACFTEWKVRRRERRKR